MCESNLYRHTFRNGLSPTMDVYVIIVCTENAYTGSLVLLTGISGVWHRLCVPLHIIKGCNCETDFFDKKHLQPFNLSNIKIIFLPSGSLYLHLQMNYDIQHSTLMIYTKFLNISRRNRRFRQVGHRRVHLGVAKFP